MQNHANGGHVYLTMSISPSGTVIGIFQGPLLRTLLCMLAQYKYKDATSLFVCFGPIATFKHQATKLVPMHGQETFN